MEALAPPEAAVPSFRRVMLTYDPELNEELMHQRLVELEEQRDRALLRIQNYQSLAALHYNKKVRGRRFMTGDLILRQVFENTSERPINKMGSKWEGPYIVSKVVKPGVYKLLTLKGYQVPHSRNAFHLKRYFD